jgi:hypothetical protein
MTPATPSAAAPGPILPPRPNLGPEPMDEPVSVVAAAAALGGVAALAGLLAWWTWRRRAAARARRSAKASAPAWVDPNSLPPRGRMLQWSEMVRRALIDRFGPPWAAKTTEEIAADPDLAGVLGAERSEELIRFLRAADLAKFAGPERNGGEYSPDQGEDWDGWVSAFVAATAVEAGARSRIKGR